MNSKRLSTEVIIATVLLVALFRFAFHIPFVNKYASTIVAVLLIYIPVIMNKWRGHPLVIEGQKWGRDIVIFLLVSVIVFPIFFALAHLWQVSVFKAGPFHVARPPGWSFVAAQLFAVALPEEVFFRGYLQTALGMYFKPRFKVFGVRFGWGLPITSVIFAFAHSAIRLQWWHFSIFFPSLLFGWMREKTGGILAAVLFHATSNVLMNWFIRCYN